MRTVKLSFLLVICGWASSVVAYEQSTHKYLTRAAFSRSSLTTDPTLLADLGVGASSVFPEFVNAPPAQNTVLATAGQLAEFGAVEEDAVFNSVSLNHFFDPQWNNGIGRPLTVFGIAQGAASPDWILEKSQSYINQFYSFPKAQSQFFLALTSPTVAARNSAMGQMFQSLGNVVHHIQDMAQPQHVRNEPHAHEQIVGTTVQWGAEANYELFTQRNIDPVLQSGPVGWPIYPIPSFSTVGQYWSSYNSTSRIGMAEFSGRNFLTFGSGLLAKFDGTFSPPSDIPMPNGKTPNGSLFSVRMQSETVQSISYQRPITGAVGYLYGTVQDDLANTSTPNQILGVSSAVVWLAPNRAAGYFSANNPTVWNANYPILLPRAIAFSAGLINHFFRGRIGFARVGTTGTTWGISNPTQFPMNGTYSVYAEDASGNRAAIPGAQFNLNIPAGSSQSVNMTEPSSGSVHLIAAFLGQIGSEANRVAGKVIAYVPPTAPATIACGGSISAAGGSAGYSATMNMGSSAGTVTIAFDAYSIPDSLKITSTNSAATVIASSGGLVSGYHAYSYAFDPGALGAQTVKVQVTGNVNTGTQWQLSVSCPNGTASLPHPTISVALDVLGVGGTCSVNNTYVIDNQTTVHSSGAAGTHIQLSPGAHQFLFSNQQLNAGCTQYGHPGYTDGLGTHDLWNGLGTSATFNVCASSGCLPVGSGPY